MYNTML